MLTRLAETSIFVLVAPGMLLQSAVALVAFKTLMPNPKSMTAEIFT